MHEALLFSARLRLPASVPAATADQFVEEVRGTNLERGGGGESRDESQACTARVLRWGAWAQQVWRRHPASGTCQDGVCCVPALNMRCDCTLPHACLNALFLCQMQVMEVVELGELRDAPIGIPGVSGLSVEQRKRLTIAVRGLAGLRLLLLAACWASALGARGCSDEQPGRAHP